MPLVLVTGLPGAGKTTLAVELAARLDLPLVAKDRYKELLFDALGTGDGAWSSKVGAAAVQLQYEAMRLAREAVVDSALWPGRSEPEVEALGLDVVQVWCDCPFEEARRRFLDRQVPGRRHPGFLGEASSEEAYERFRSLARPLELSAPLVRVDTSAPVDVEDVVSRVLAAPRATTRGRGGTRRASP